MVNERVSDEASWKFFSRTKATENGRQKTRFVAKINAGRIQNNTAENAYHIPNFGTDYEWKSSEKCSLFVSPEQLEQLCQEHCATVWHIRKILAPFSFSRVQPFSPLFHFFFLFPFLSVSYFLLLIKEILGAFLLKQLFYSGLPNVKWL